MRVLICDNLDPVGARVLREAGDIEVDVRNDLDAAGQRGRIRRA